MGMSKRYLRCALVWENTLIDERVFASPMRITIGESSRSTFALHSSCVGKRHVLFEHDKSQTKLRLVRGMVGRLKVGGEVCEAETLFMERGNGKQYAHPLTEEDGGILVFGRTGLLFQFTKDLGRVERARFNQVVGTDGYMNRLFSFVIAGVMLFAFISQLFAQAPNTFTVEQLPDRIVSYVIEDPESAKHFKKEMVEERKKESIQEKAKETAKANRVKRITPENEIDLETQRIRDRVAGKGVIGAIAVAKRRGGALQKVLDDGGLESSLNSALLKLDKGQASAQVITSKSSDALVSSTSIGQNAVPEVLSETLRENAPATGQTGRKMAGGSRLQERKEAEVSVSLPALATEVTGGVLDKKDISNVILRNKGAIRYCYESQLLRYPTLRGQVIVDFIIELDGTVQTVKIPTNTLTQAEAKEKVASCLIKFIKRWVFPKPQGGKVRVIYPFTYGRSQ
jgi:hypothetical protein